jgi:predicted XRE-type DNA-binding protein
MRSSPEATDDIGLKVALAGRINEVISLRGLSQSEAAAEVGTSQPKISQIRRYKLNNISVGRLLQALVALGQRIDIVISPAGERSSPAVRVAA